VSEWWIERAMDGLAVSALVTTRITGLMLTAPFLSDRTFPLQVRIGFTLLLSLALTPVLLPTFGPGVPVALLAQPAVAILALAGELGLGWLMGWVASVMVWAAQLAGHLLGQDIGYSLGGVIDPGSATSGSPTTHLMTLFAVMAFIALEGHRLLLLALGGSLQMVPVGSVGALLLGGGIDPDVGATIASGLGGQIWSLGVQIALPGILVLLFTTIGMGILARVVPEMNVLVLGFALRTVVGLLALFLVLPFVADLFSSVVHGSIDLIDLALERVGGG